MWNTFHWTKKKAFISIFHDSRTEKIAWSAFMADIFHRYGSELSTGSHQKCLHLVGSVHNKKAPVIIQVVNCKLPTLLIRHLHTFDQKRLKWNTHLLGENSYLFLKCQLFVFQQLAVGLQLEYTVWKKQNDWHIWVVRKKIYSISETSCLLCFGHLIIINVNHSYEPQQKLKAETFTNFWPQIISTSIPTLSFCKASKAFKSLCLFK